MGNESIFDKLELGQVFTISTKAVNPNIHPNQEYKHFSIPVFDESKTPVIELGAQIKSNKYLLEKDSILVSKLNPRIKRVWQYKHSQNEAVSVCSTEFIVYQSTNKSVNMDFYFHYFNSDIFQEYLLALQSGTTGSRMRVVPRDTLELNIPVPTINEQQKIASILSSVDEAIEKTEAIIEKIEKVKKGLMQQVLTKGIRHTKFKKTEIGEIPEGWSVEKLSDIARVIDCKHYTPQYCETGIPIVRTNNLTATDLDLEGSYYTSEEDYFKLTDKYTPKKGDIIYGREGSFGVASYVNTDERFSIGQRVVVISPLGIQGRYLHYALNADIIFKQVILVSLGTTVKRINVSDIKNLLIPLPPRREQEQIVNTIFPLFQRIENEQRYLDTLNKLKKGLMQSLLTGRVRVKINEAEVTQV